MIANETTKVQMKFMLAIIGNNEVKTYRMVNYKRP